MLDFDDLALAEHDRAECEAADRQAALGELTDRVQLEIERDVMRVLSAGDLASGKVIAGEARGKNKGAAVKQDAVDMLFEACLDNTRNLKLLSELIALPVAIKLRQEIAKTHAAVNASIVAEARGLS